MDALIEFGKIVIPAVIVMYAMFLVMRSFLMKDRESKLLDIRVKNNEIVMPIRLQAYERMCLFLERINPHNLIPRLNLSEYTSREFQQILLKEIREEYNHNLSQQVYMTDESWGMIKNAMEEVIMIINQAADQLKEEAKSIDLAKAIFEDIMERKIDPIDYPLKNLKDEIREVF